MADSPLTPSLWGILDKLYLGPTASQYLTQIRHPENSTPEKLAHILNGNQAYVQFFPITELMRGRKTEWLDEPSKAGEEIVGPVRKVKSPAHYLVTWLGPGHSRNAILCLRQLRLLGLLPKNSGVPIELGAKKRLRRAMECQELSEDRRIAHAEMNFVGGLVFDWVIAFGLEGRLLAGKLVQYTDKLWKTALYSALIAYRLASGLKKFELESTAFASAITLETGNLLLALHHGDEYLKLETHPAIAVDPSLLPKIEKRRFGLTSEMVAALISASFDPLTSVAPALLYAREPFALRGRGVPDLERIAAILNASRSVARVHTPSAHTLRWLAAVGVGADALTEAVSWASETMAKEAK